MLGGLPTARELRRLFDSRDWALIVYDKVHLPPAPIFRLTADLQSRRPLGLTATLIREDGREGGVFSLIGPKVSSRRGKRSATDGSGSPMAWASSCW
jgi:superfamily II DNA or RNA helicase